MREGSESDIFWNALGGKSEYARGKEIKGYIEDPHLFMLSGIEGKKKFPVFEMFLRRECSFGFGSKSSWLYKAVKSVY